LTYQWLKDGAVIPLSASSSANASTLQLSNIAFSNAGVYTAIVTNSAGSVRSTPIFLNVASTVLPAWRMVNVSTRTAVGTGANILIQGFVVAGNASKQVLVRAVGPSLAAFGVTGSLQRPSLSMYQDSTMIAQNTVWGGSTALIAAFAAVGAFPLQSSSSDSAILVTLQPGNYTAQVSGVGGTTGVALIEVYELP